MLNPVFSGPDQARLVFTDVTGNSHPNRLPILFRHRVGKTKSTLDERGRGGPNRLSRTRNRHVSNNLYARRHFIDLTGVIALGSKGHLNASGWGRITSFAEVGTELCLERECQRLSLDRGEETLRQQIYSEGTGYSGLYLSASRELVILKILFVQREKHSFVLRRDNVHGFARDIIDS